MKVALRQGFPTNPVDMLPLVQSIGGGLQKQRCLSHTRRPIDLCDLPSRISTRNIVAWQAWWGKKLVELREPSRYGAGATRIEALERL